jgi:peroxiredoxin
MNKTIFIGVAVIALAIGLLAWDKNGSVDTRTTDTHTPTSASSTLAPDFSLAKLDGGTITLSDYKGVKPIILDFWTTWCPNCRRDMPRQNEWYKKYKDKIEVIGIDMQEDSSTVGAFIQKLGIEYPIALDPQGATVRAYGVRYTNYHVLIDKDGNIVKTIPGDISEQDFISLINQ